MSTAPGPPRPHDEVVESVFAPRRVLAVVALMAAALAVSAGYLYSRHALDGLSRSHEDPPLDFRIVPTARFAWLEGSVLVNRAGAFVWVNADLVMTLTSGDRVRTGPAAAAEIHFFNGDIFHMRPDSLITIEKGWTR